MRNCDNSRCLNIISLSKTLLIFLLVTGCLGTTVRVLARPNVLFIAVDDLRVELGCYGNNHVITPNIDRLAQQGTLFERAYCQQTVCNPSRASVMTGLRPDTLGVWDLFTHFRQNKPDAITLPQVFMKSGYHAQCIGKIFHNWRQDDWKGDRVSWSVPEFLHYATHGSDQPEVDGDLPPNLASGTGGIECRDVPDNAYFDGRIAEKAVLTLKELHQNQKPFFLAVGFWKPHTPFNAPKQYWDWYNRGTVPVPVNLEPPIGVPEIALTSSRYDGGSKPDELREMHHGHLAAISYLDTQIGKVLDQLDQLEMRDNTIVVFWSDHGLHLGEHGLTRKTTAFELDAAVPLIIATPQHSRGQRVSSLVELLDLYPTLTDLCGLTPPDEIEGESLVHLLEDPSRFHKSAALTQTPRPNYPKGQRPVNMGYSVRTEHFRYNEWRNFDTKEIIARELYDHVNDPSETINLANQLLFENVIPDIAIQLQELVK